MIWKRYRNELIVALSLLLLLSAIGYKRMAVSSSVENKSNTKYAVREFQELISLKKRWADKKISKKVDKLQKLLPDTKVKWKKKGKKLSASYKGLTSKELNKVITGILNIAVQIELLEIRNNNSSYDVEFKCKW